MQGMQVWSLVGEPRSQMLHNMAEKKTNYCVDYVVWIFHIFTSVLLACFLTWYIIVSYY